MLVRAGSAPAHFFVGITCMREMCSLGRLGYGTVHWVSMMVVGAYSCSSADGMCVACGSAVAGNAIGPPSHPKMCVCTCPQLFGHLGVVVPRIKQFCLGSWPHQTAELCAHAGLSVGDLNLWLCVALVDLAALPRSTGSLDCTLPQESHWPGEVDVCLVDALQHSLSLDVLPAAPHCYDVQAVWLLYGAALSPFLRDTQHRVCGHP